MEAVRLGAKASFLVGFSDGMAVARASQKVLDEFGSNTATIDESVKGVDDIYEKAENAALPIICALEVFIMKVKGVPLAQISDRLAELRKISADSITKAKSAAK